MQNKLIINKLHIIRFGGISEQLFTFNPDTNIIYGENRSGKTTLCEFIRFMFYGFEGRDAQDFYPWNNDTATVCGSMTVKYGKDTIEIFRENGTDTNTLQLTNIEKSAPYELENKILSPGMAFLGISAMLYDKSLYCPQDAAGLVSDGDLVHFEGDLIKSYSGEENFSTLSKTLLERKNLLLNNEKSGKIDVLCTKKEAIESELIAAILKQNELINTEASIARAEEKLLEVEKKIVITKSDIENINNLHMKENDEKLITMQEEIAAKKAEYEKLLKLHNDENTISQKAASDRLARMYSDLAVLEKELEIESEKLKNSKDNLDLNSQMSQSEEFSEDAISEVSNELLKREKLSKIFLVSSFPLFAICAITFIVLFLFMKQLPQEYILVISGSVLALSLASLITSIALNLSKSSLLTKVGARTMDEFEEIYNMFASYQQTQLLYKTTYEEESRYYLAKKENFTSLLSSLNKELHFCRDGEDFTFEQMGEKIKSLSQAANITENARIEYENIQKEYDSVYSDELIKKNEDYKKTMRDKERELAWYTNQKEALYEKKRALQDILSIAVIHTERPVYIKTSLNALQNDLDELYKDYNALDIAQRVFGDALTVMKFRIKNHLSDGINYRLKFALSEDESFLVDDSYSLQYKNSSRLVPVFTDSISRSSGSTKGINKSLAELAALALRMSLIELLEIDTAPCLFDEPFAFIDNNGEERMLKKLSSSGFEQIIIFTSHTISQDNTTYTYHSLTK